MPYNAARNQYEFGQPGGAAYVYTADGAISHANGVHAIAKAGSLASMTLTPPTADEEGTRITITARTAFAHKVTLTEGLGGKGGNFDVMTFAAVGDTIDLLADNLHWVPTSAPYGVTVA